MVRHYELTLISDSQGGEEAVNQTVGKYESFLKDNGADPLVADRRGVRKLAYEIKKHVQADYTYFQFSGDTGMVQDMDRQLRLDGAVLRHLFVKLDEAPVLPSEETEEAEEASADGDGDAAASDAEEEGAE